MTDENPILNNPYEEPNWHYSTNLEGELDYTRPVKGLRIFTPEVQTIPVRQGSQGELMELNDLAAREHSQHPVNLLRREVGIWRDAKYPQTTRITRELLQFCQRGLSRNHAVGLGSAPASGAVGRALASHSEASNLPTIWCFRTRVRSARGRAEPQPGRLCSPGTQLHGYG